MPDTASRNPLFSRSVVQEMRPTVLISGIGGDIAQGVATILRECRPDLRLIGTDIHDCHAGKKWVDRAAVLPKATDKDYIPRLKEVLDKEEVRFFIPMTEAELAVLVGRENELGKIRWITPGLGVLKAGLDKWETYQALLRLQLPAPESMLPPFLKSLEFPCIIKNRFGSGSRGLAKVYSKQELSFLAQRLEKPLLQELLLPDDREVTCAVYRNREGKVVSLQMLRRLMGGFTSWAKVIFEPQVKEMCEKIAIGLDLQGSMNIQLRITQKGPRVFEINPRFSSTVLMRHRFGFTDVLWAMAEAEGKALVYPKIPNKGILARTQDAVVLSN